MHPWCNTFFLACSLVQTRRIAVMTQKPILAPPLNSHFLFYMYFLYIAKCKNPSTAYHSVKEKKKQAPMKDTHTLTQKNAPVCVGIVMIRSRNSALVEEVNIRDWRMAVCTALITRLVPVHTTCRMATWYVSVFIVKVRERKCSFHLFNFTSDPKCHQVLDLLIESVLFNFSISLPILNAIKCLIYWLIFSL